MIFYAIYDIICADSTDENRRFLFDTLPAFAGFFNKKLEKITMSRQIQIRRGTAAENNAFTGAIGEVTMDTTNKTLRVHDGTTTGGTVLAKKSEIPDLTNADYIIESQLPTSDNNYTWYRKYKSGWVEQGGYVASGGAGILVTLAITMSNANYHIILTGNHDSRTAGSTTSISTNSGAITTTGFYVNNYVENGSNRDNGDSFWWMCCGLCNNTI